MTKESQPRVAVVTGAARGIGSAIAEGLLHEGYVVVALDRAWDPALPLYQRLQLSSSCLTLTCDITSIPDIEAAYASAIARFGTVDVLINNAAMRQRDVSSDSGTLRVLEVLDEQWERMVAVNLVGTMRVTRSFMRPMLRNGSGSVVTISSRGTVSYESQGTSWVRTRMQPLNQPYEASKAALTSAMFFLAEEVRQQGVAVNIVFPGVTRTTGSDELAAGRRARGIDVAMHDPQHVFPVVSFLASQRGNALTGKGFDAQLWKPEFGVHALVPE